MNKDDFLEDRDLTKEQAASIDAAASRPAVNVKTRILPSMADHRRRNLKMIEKANRYTIRLDIIAIFSTFAEVSGIIALPFLEKEAQLIYVCS